MKSESTPATIRSIDSDAVLWEGYLGAQASHASSAVVSLADPRSARDDLPFPSVAVLSYSAVTGPATI